jgi:L-amino acid N-acyltransferase YncA
VTAYRVRLAAAPDAEAICRIYNQGIEDRVATLETEHARRAPPVAGQSNPASSGHRR